jgi:hypothetical protein
MTWGIRIEVAKQGRKIDLKQQKSRSIVVWAVAINNKKYLMAHVMNAPAVTLVQQL